MFGKRARIRGSSPKRPRSGHGCANDESRISASVSGHQLLADALGGIVRKMDVPEIGVCEVTLNPAGASAPLFRDLPLVPPGAPMHGAAVERVPDGGVVLASNAHCAIQSFSFADIAYGVQYHMEANRVPDPGAEPDSRISGITRADRRRRSAAFRRTNY